MRGKLAAITIRACAALVVVTAVSAQVPAAARVAPVPDAQRSEEQRSIASEFTSTGMVNAVATLLHYPALAQALLTHERYVSTASTLPPRHRLLLLLRTSWLARSDYLWAHRAAAARRAGFTDEDLTRIARGGDAAGWDPFEADLLRAADELHVDSFISDATWRALSARYDTNQMIDTIDTVGATTMHAGVLNSLGVQVEAGVTDRRPMSVPYRPTAKRVNIRLLGKEPRIPPVPARNPDGTVRQSANVFSTFVRNPPADRARGAINGHVNSRSTLMPQHRELLLMRIGVLCRSEYEYAAHNRVGRRAGMTDADVDRILRGPGSGGGAVEDALLRATDELFENDAVSAGTWAALAKTLDTRQMFDVLIAVGGYRSTSLLINSAGVQLDDNMADFRFPPSLR
jgi:4-carboxymuconolactone decarboxylase